MLAPQRSAETGIRFYPTLYKPYELKLMASLVILDFLSLAGLT